MTVRARLVSITAAGALAAGALAFAPAPARAATPTPISATYQCTGAGGLSSVSVPLTLTLQELTDGLTAGTPLQPVLSSVVGQTGSALNQLLAVVDSVLSQVLGTLFGFLNQIFGPLFPDSTFSAKVADLQLQLVDGLGTAVSSLGATLSGSLKLSQLKDGNPITLALAPLTGGLTAATGGTYDLTAPQSFNLDFLGDTVSQLGCTVQSVGGAVAKVVNGRVVLQSGVKVTPTGTKPGTTGSVVGSANPCTVALPKVGTKKTALKLTLAKKRIASSAVGKLTVRSTFKVKKGGKKVTKKAKGTIVVCDGSKALGYAKVKGKTRIKLPKLAAGKHRLLVRYLGAGKAKPANKRVTLIVKRA